MQVSRFIKSFLGAMVFSLVMLLPKDVYASSLETEMFDNLYNLIKTNPNGKVTDLDSSYSEKIFQFNIEDTHIGSIQSNASRISVGSFSTEGQDIRVRVLVVNANGNSILLKMPKIAEGSKYAFSLKVLNSANYDMNLTYLPLELQEYRPEPISLPEPEPEPEPTYNNAIELVIGSILNAFKSLKGYGINIVLIAIGLGVTFIGGNWLWGKTKIWLKKI